MSEYYDTSIWDEPGNPHLWEEDDECPALILIMQMPQSNQRPYESDLLTFDDLDDAIQEHIPLAIESLLEEASKLRAELEVLRSHLDKQFEDARNFPWPPE